MNVRCFELTSQEQQEVSQFFEEFRWDGMVNVEQITQMHPSFCGAADTMGETMARLKAALAEIKVLNKTIETLLDANKQLTAVVASLEKRVGKTGSHTTTQTADKEKEQEKELEQDYETGKCPCCESIHRLFWKAYCRELKKNAYKCRPSSRFNHRNDDKE